MKETILSLLENAVITLKQQGTLPDTVTPAIKVDATKDKAHGDYATNLALMLSKPAGKKPRELAEALVAKLKGIDLNLAQRWASLYGSRAWHMLGEARCVSELGEQFSQDLYAQEVDYLRQQEWG